MPDIFVSYSQHDYDKVQPLVGAIEADGFSVWWDPQMLPGDRIPAVISKILEDVSCVIVVWSARSLNSNWVPDEAAYGRDHTMLVQVSLDGSKAPLGFQQLLSQDLTGWNGDPGDPRIHNVIAAVRRMLGRGDGEPAGSRSVRKAEPVGSTEAAALRQRYQGTRNKSVFLVAGSFNEEWQISLNFQLMQALQRAGLSSTVLVPSEDHSVDQQRMLLQNVHADGNDYFGGLVICSGWPDEQISELVELAKNLARPVVLVDRNPPAGKPVPAKVSYVSVNDAEGGALAAEAVLQLSDELPIRRILVVAGFAKHARYTAFQDAIRKSNKLTGCEVVITEDGQFDRWISENVTYNLLTDALEKKKPFDVVFCIADSMTLGCLDAIDRVRRWGRHPKPRVVGYDATTTTRNLVDSKRSPLVRIVVQDTKALASAAREQLIRMNQPEAEELPHVKWVEPYLYPRLQRAFG
jgi:DNA-binding LacI/PurR family transcriptional regulator